MKKVKINYSAFQDMDIFFSHSNKLFGRIIRLATTLKWNPKDDITPTHGGFITEDHGQFFATEMGMKIGENSLEKYTGKREQIVEVWRCKRFADKEKLYKAHARLTYLRRQRLDYDLPGAILSSPLGRKLFGWIPGFKNQRQDNFCTENVADVIRSSVDGSCPKAPSPLTLSNYFKAHDGTYRKVKGFTL